MSGHFQEKKLAVVGRHIRDNDPMTRVLLFHQVHRDAVKLLGYESDSRWWKVFSLMRLYLKYRHQMFYSYEKDPVAMVRALLQPWMQIYLYYQRYMTH